MISKIFKLLKSKKLAYILIISLTGYSLIGMVIPFLFKSEYNNSFFSSPVLSILAGLFFLNTLVCTIEQGKTAYKFPRLVKKNTNSAKLQYSSIITKELDIQDVSNKLKSKGFKVSLINDKIFAHKGQYSLWGAFIFHLSFLLIIIAVIISIETSFEGKLYINEGEELTDAKDSYTDLKVTPFFNNSFYGFNVKLNKFSVDYPSDYYPSNLTSDITLSENGQEIDRLPLKVMPPYRLGPYSFIQGSFGYSPHLIITKGGATLVNAYAAINSIVTFENEKYQDEFEIPPLKLNIEFLPDGKEVKGNRTFYNPIAPGYKLNIYEGNNLLYNGILPQNKKVNFKDYTLIIPDYIYWSQIKVVKDYGVNILYFGFLLGTLGISLFYFGNYQYLWINDTSEESGYPSFRVGAGTKRRNPFYEEKFKELITYLEK